MIEELEDEADRAVSSLQESINSWRGTFKDLNDGGDTKIWQQLAIKELAPAMLFGQQAKGIRLPGIFRPDERTQLSLPAFFDTDPQQSDQPTPTGTKLRFNGKSAKGLLVVTDQSVKTGYLFGQGVVAGQLPRSGASYLGEVATKLSLLSMTSAGATYEALFVEEDGDFVRLMFRVALEPRKPGFTEVLQRAMGVG